MLKNLSHACLADADSHARFLFQQLAFTGFLLTMTSRSYLDPPPASGSSSTVCLFAYLYRVAFCVSLASSFLRTSTVSYLYRLVPLPSSFLRTSTVYSSFLHTSTV